MEKKKKEEKEGEVEKDAGKTPKIENSQVEIKLSRDEYDALMNRLEELEGLREKLLRSAADFENAKKRLSREKEEFLKFAHENLIRSLLPVLDNFERALQHAGQVSFSEEGKEDQRLQGVVSGIQMVHKQLTETLKSHGLVKLQTLKETFDPHQHEAVGFVQEEGREDEVVEEVESGYRLHDRLLRASKVRVRMVPPSSERHRDHSEPPAQTEPPSEQKNEEIT